MGQAYVIPYYSLRLCAQVIKNLCVHDSPVGRLWLRPRLFFSFDYQLFADLLKLNSLIMSVFHSVPGVPCAKMERLPRDT